MESGLNIACTLCDPDNVESAVPHEMKALRLRVANMCCAGEENTIRQVLAGFKGIEDVSINVIGKNAVLKHCPQNCCAPVSGIVSALNDKMLGVSIQENFEGNIDQLEPESMSVSSILHILVIAGLFAIAAGYELAHPSLDDGTLKVAAITYILCGFIGAVPIFPRATEVISRGNIDINVLVLLATFASFLGQDFRDGALVITLYNAAKAFEEFVMHRVRNAIKISASNIGRFAMHVDGTELKKCLLEDLRIGDIIAIRSGDMIPMDGLVTAGQAVVDESAITGEAAPVQKSVGSEVMSGGLLQNGYMEVAVEVELKDSVMRKLNDTVNDVQAKKGTFATTVDRFAAYWVPFVIMCAILFIITDGFVTGNWKSAVNRGLVLMLLACPCSIVLASPIASLSTIAVAAKHGVIIKGSKVLENLGTIDTVAVDKTGTMTEGSFNVLGSLRFTTEKEEDEGSDVYNPVKLAAALESKSSHPLANAIIREFTDCVTEMEIPLPDSKRVKTLDGIGVEGWVDISGQDPVHVAVGNERLFKGYERLGLNANKDSVFSNKPDKLGGKCILKKGQLEKLKEFAKKWGVCTVIYITVEDELALCMALGDVIRPESYSTVQKLSQLGCKVVMLTGDATPVAYKVCKELNIQDCRSRLRPDEKYTHICQLKDDGRRVAMLGDGINDTTALAAASVGIAMGAGGAAMAVNAADVVLMSNNLSRLPALFSVSKKCSSIIIQNICLSVGIKITAMILAALGYLVLWEAICVDAGSLLLVLINGLRPMYENEFDICEDVSVDFGTETPNEKSTLLGNGDKAKDPRNTYSGF